MVRRRFRQYRLKQRNASSGWLPKRSLTYRVGIAQMCALCQFLTCREGTERFE
jgi:hypothetical protein